MTVEMLVFQSDLLMLYVCGCSGQSDSCSLTHTLTHEYIHSHTHTELYSHLKAYVEALLVGTHKVSELSVNLCLPSMEPCISQLSSGKSPNGHLIVMTMHP